MRDWLVRDVFFSILDSFILKFELDPVFYNQEKVKCYYFWRTKFSKEENGYEKALPLC